MRTFFIVRGAPGIGKSTFLSLYQARGQVVSLDGIRDVFAMPVPDWDGVPGRSIRGGTEETISHVLEAALRSRFEQGGDVFFDATNPELQQFKHLADLSRAYGYQVAVIDMQGDATDSMILAQNEKRAGTVSYVPEEDVLRISTRVREGTLECRRYAGRGMWVSAQWEERDCGLHLANLDAMREFVRSTIDGHYTRTITMKPGENVVIIGSAYGDAQTLSKALMEAWDATKGAIAVTWVFLGDTLADSPHVAQVWKILNYFEAQAKQHGHTVIFLEGIDETILRETLTRAVNPRAFPDVQQAIGGDHPHGNAEARPPAPPEQPHLRAHHPHAPRHLLRHHWRHSKPGPHTHSPRVHQRRERPHQHLPQEDQLRGLHAAPQRRSSPR